MAIFEQATINELTVTKMFGPGAPLDFKSNGRTFFVDSNRVYPSSRATLAAGLNECTSNKGDLICIVPGHAETLTSTLAISKAGVTVLCYGNGNNRPTFTVNAAIPGFNVTGGDFTIYNARIIAGSSVTTATRLARVASNRVKFIGCQFEMAYKIFHMIVILSGDQVIFENCTFINTYAPGTGAAGAKAQTALLNIGGTRVRVSDCRFNDIRADKAHRWKTCVEGGKLTADLTIEKSLFICRGVATQTRSAGASGLQFTIDCRGISPSSNTAVGAIFYGKYQHLIETYNVAAVNKLGLLTVTAA